MFIHSMKIVMKGFGVNRKKVASIQRIRADHVGLALSLRGDECSFQGRDRDCFPSILKSELFTTFITGGFLRKFFITT